MIDQSVYENLVHLAQNRQTTNYRPIALLAGIDAENPHFAALVGGMLDEINRAEHVAGRPLLSAVVTSLESNRPGSGFFECARSLGLLKGNDEDAFWVSELNRVHDYWSPRHSQQRRP